MEKENQAHLNKLKFYKAFFKSKQGQRVLWDLMKTHHVLGSCFVKGDRDEYLVREGERNVVLRILSLLQVDPEALEQMIDKEERMKDEY